MKPLSLRNLLTDHSFVPIASAICCLLISSCVAFPPAPVASVSPRIDNGKLVSIDGAELGLDVWRAENPKAVIVAVHGMNDYGHHFKALGEYLSQNGGVTLFAYDQRGFGRSPDFGRWPGEGAMIADLNAAIAAARAENPGRPLYVLGHSMGAAVVMAAAEKAPLDVDGAILASPGVWGGRQLPILYRIALNVSASVLPGKTLTGARTKRRSTDNIEILREMYKDPYVIKPTRMDAILGVVRLMGEGYEASNEIGGRVLFLYGEKDEIIPVKAMAKTAKRLCGDVDAIAYPEGWHLIFNDLQAEKVWSDVGAWVAANESAAGRTQQFGPAALVCSGAGQGVSAG